MFVIYTTPFYNFKISIPNGSASSFREIISVRGQKRLAWRSQASEAFIGLTSNKSDDGDHNDLLGSDKPGLSEAPTRLFKAPTGLFKAFAGPPQASLAQDPGANCYSEQDLDKIIQTFLHTSKDGSGDKLKAKTPNIYCNRSHIECYNFCQQYKDHFATYEVTEPKQIPFATFFLWDQIDFHWQKHKCELESESLVLISWNKFKVFLYKALGNSRAFMDS